MSRQSRAPSKTRSFNPIAHTHAKRGTAIGGGDAGPTPEQMKRAINFAKGSGKTIDKQGRSLSFSNPTQALSAIKNKQVDQSNYIDIANNLGLVSNIGDCSPNQALEIITAAVDGRFDKENDHSKILQEELERQKIGTMKQSTISSSRPDVDLETFKNNLAKNKGLQLMEVVSSFEAEPYSPAGFTGSGTENDLKGKFTDTDEMDRHKVPNRGEKKPGGDNIREHAIGESEDDLANSPHQAIRKVEMLRKQLNEAELQAREARLLIRIKNKDISEVYAKKIHAILDEFEEEKLKTSLIKDNDDTINNRKALLFVDSEFTDDEISYEEIDDFLKLSE